MNEKMIKEIKEEAYNKGLNDAWELARKIGVPEAEGGLPCDDVYRVFGVDICWKVLTGFTPQEALAELKAYEEAQSKIKVGDVVESNYHKVVVTHILGDRLSGIDENGETFWCANDDCKKTGKHIDIASILEQIREV